MDHSKFKASIQKEEFISSIKSSANYYIQHQSLCKVKSCEFRAAVSLNCIYSTPCKFHAESTPVMESFYEVYF